MKICITGNNRVGLSKALGDILPDLTFISRSNGFDLTTRDGQERATELIVSHDVVVNCAALWKFNQTVLLDAVYKMACERNPNLHIICVGSTTDRVKNGKAWLYNAEKKALRDYSNTLAIGGVWGTTPKVSYISFGTLDNNQHKHPDRRCMDIGFAASYVKWLIEQPRHLNINEISIDPMQDAKWYE